MDRWIGASLPKVVLFLALVIGTMASTLPVHAAISTGSTDFQFSNWAGPDLKAYAYRPTAAPSDAPIMIVMHGTNRDPERYRDEWVPVADALGIIIIAPEFDKARFPKSAEYNLGGIAQGWPNPASAFSAIEPLFDDVKERLGGTQAQYYLYGHSAGGQFVHRFLFANPDARVEMAFAANSGWYTMLSKGTEFPYGLKNSNLPSRTDKTALSAPLVVLLGDQDTLRGGSLRKSAEADAQGFNRLQRGMMFFSHAATLASQSKIDFAWRMSVIPGAGHQNRRMAWGVVPFIEAVDLPSAASSR